MKAEDRAAFIEKFLEDHCRAVMRDKGTEYSRGEADVNSNFARGADVIGVDSIAVLYVYLSKHWDAIVHYIKTRESLSEPIAERIGDAVNYLLILAAMLDEQERGSELQARGRVEVTAFGDSEPTFIDWDAPPSTPIDEQNLKTEAIDDRGARARAAAARLKARGDEPEVVRDIQRGFE